MIDEKLAEKIIAAAKKEPKTVLQQFLKLMEETGEASQAYLSATHASGNDYKKLDFADTKEELADTLLVILAILVKLGCSTDELEKLLNKKTDKWLSHQIH